MQMPMPRLNLLVGRHLSLAVVPALLQLQEHGRVRRSQLLDLRLLRSPLSRNQRTSRLYKVYNDRGLR